MKTITNPKIVCATQEPLNPDDYSKYFFIVYDGSNKEIGSIEINVSDGETYHSTGWGCMDDKEEGYSEELYFDVMTYIEEKVEQDYNEWLKQDEQRISRDNYEDFSKEELFEEIESTKRELSMSKDEYRIVRRMLADTRKY